MTTKTNPKYNVTWTCPHCGNMHNWWWDDKYEAHVDAETNMQCDHCEAHVKCKGDGFGFYEPIIEVKEDNEQKWPGVGPDFESVLDELRNSRKAHFSLIQKLIDRTDELDNLNTDVHNYCRSLEDKVNGVREDLYAVVNSLAKHVAQIEEKTDEHRQELDNVGRRLTTSELAIANLEDGIGVNTYSDRKKPEKQPRVMDLIDGPKGICVLTPPGPKQPFYERFREGCGFTKETLDGETLAKMLRFVAVEVERMTERDMVGSFTISNLKVGEKLRELALEAQVNNCDNSGGEEEETYAAGFDWGAIAGDDECGKNGPNNAAFADIKSSNTNETV